MEVAKMNELGIIEEKGMRRLATVKKEQWKPTTYHGIDLRLVGTCLYEPFGACFIYDRGQSASFINVKQDTKNYDWHIYVPMDQQQNIRELYINTLTK